MTSRTWQTSTALRGNAFLVSNDLLLIADQGSPQQNAAHAEAVERLVREMRRIRPRSRRAAARAPA